MEDVQANNVEFVLKSVDDQNMIIQDPKEINDQCNLKTTGYLLDVTSNPIAAGSQDGQFVTADAICQDNQGTQFVTLEVENTDQIILQEKEVILWNDICRICANGSDRFIPIFTGDGLEHDLCTKIQTYLPLQVSEEDSLPHQICYNCAATLLAWHDIYKGCIDAQQRLIELQNKIKDQYYNESTIAEENNQAVLEVQTSNIEEPQIQAKDEEQNNPESEQVVNIAESERSSKSLNLGIKNKESIKTSKTLSKVKVEPSDNKKWMKVADFAKSPLEPLDSIHPKSDKTDVKIVNTNVNDLINADITDEEDDVKVIEISTSGDSDDYNFTQSMKLRMKKKKQKLNDPAKEVLVCPDCSKPFKYKDCFRRHLRIHSNERPFTCHVCDKQFRDPTKLSRHLRVVHAKLKK